MSLIDGINDVLGEANLRKVLGVLFTHSKETAHAKVRCFLLRWCAWVFVCMAHMFAMLREVGEEEAVSADNFAGRSARWAM